MAVADNPWGPFQDATPGKYLVDGGWGGGNIDSTVFVDDNGYPDDPLEWDAYLYWGNPYLRYCKLTDDMLDIEVDTDGDGVLSEWENTSDPRFDREDNKILGAYRPGLHSFQIYGEEGYQAFGIPTVNPGSTGKFPKDPAGSEQPRSAFEEGPWLWKHEDDDPNTEDYFLVYPGERFTIRPTVMPEEATDKEVEYAGRAKAKSATIGKGKSNVSISRQDNMG